MTDAGTLEALLSHVADKPAAMARLAHVLLTKGRGDHARELCHRAMAMAPEDAEVHALAAAVLSYGVADWYFPMVRDRERHAAYEAAMRRAIRPGCSVLEIGTGTGLLAMMAVRAGAAKVVTCESDPAVADAAHEIIVRNGLADRVHVVAKSSLDLEIGADLDEPADVLVWDALSNNMIGAGALPTMEHAMRHLMRPGARAIPSAGAIRISLAEDRRVHDRQMDTVEGFDLSPFNRLASPSYQIPIGDNRLLLRSEPTDLFHFDFQKGGPFPEARAKVRLASSGGLVNGVAQWLSFQMDDDVRYENVPAVGANSAFAALFHPLMRAVKTEPGRGFAVCSSHDRLSLRIWAEAPLS